MDIKRIALFSAISACLGFIFIFPLLEVFFPFFFQLSAWLLWYFLHRKWKESSKKIPYWEKGIEFSLVLAVFFLAYYISSRGLGNEMFGVGGMFGVETNAGYVSFIPFSYPSLLLSTFHLLAYNNLFLSILILIALWDIAILIMEKIWDYLEEKEKTVQIIIKRIIIVLIILNMIISNFTLLGTG